MLSILELNKRRYSLILFIVSLVIFILPFVFICNIRVRVILGVLFLITNFLALIYRIKGIALAIMCLIYILLLVFGVAVSVLLSSIPFPNDNNREAYNIMMSFIVIMSVLVSPIPILVIDKCEYKMGMNNVTRRKQGATFTEYMGYKKRSMYLTKPYRLAFCSKTVGILRLTIGSLLVVIGLIGLGLSLNSTFEFNDMFRSFDFWLYFSSIYLIVHGLVIVLAGFFRSLYVLISFACIMLMFYFSYNIGAKLFKQSIFLFILFIITIIALVILTTIYLVRKISLSNYRGYFTNYRKGNYIIGVDMFIYDMMPIIGYNDVVAIYIDLDESVNFNDIDLFIKEFDEFSDIRKILFLGYKVDFSIGRFTLFISNNKLKRKNSVNRFIENWFSLNYEIVCFEDQIWDFYIEKLHPDEYIRFEIANQNFIYKLESKGFDFSKEYSVYFINIFFDFDSAIKFKDEAIQRGFLNVEYVDNTKQVEVEGLSIKYSYVVLFALRTKVGVERMNMNTENVIDFAKKYNGELYEWFIDI